MKFLPRIPQGLLLAWLLGLVFLVLPYVRILGDSQSALFDHAAYRAVFEGSILGTRLAELIAWFVAAQVFLHLAYGTLCWILARLTLVAFPENQQSPRALTALWFLVTGFWLLAWNSGEFPNSSMGDTYRHQAALEIAGMPLYWWITGLLALAVATVIVFAAWRSLGRSSLLQRRRRLAVAGSMAVVGISMLAWPEFKVDPAPADKPNIIFLGIDSLRYDEMRMGSAQSHTPHIDDFLGDAVRLDNAMTPLARTFPSWVALLTGRHPHTTGAILNLLPPGHMNRGVTLPEILRQQGYRTAYAIDEVRFSNIDKAYGFDETETPGIGSADFILGIGSDTPLLNLVVNTDIGKWLFPYAHANRANSNIYDPQSFVERVRDDIEYRSPMFLAAHMTLPHWPYRWRDSRNYRRIDGEVRPQFYIDAVGRADQQFGDILQTLQQRGMLENAIVVAFSDHGETFGAEQDVLVPRNTPVLSEIRATPGWGHGTTVLSPHQYRIFLAVRAYGPARKLLGETRGTNPAMATLEDVTPTILDALKVRAPMPVDGVSLLANLRGDSAGGNPLSQRVRFTETEFNPMSLVNMTGDTAAVNASSLAAAAQYYRVDPVTDRLEMKVNFLDTLRRNRQFAAVGWTQMLGAFPQPLTDSYVFLVVDLRGGLPRRVMETADLARDTEVAALWRSLCQRYGEIIDAGTQPIHCTPVQLANRSN